MNRRLENIFAIGILVILTGIVVHAPLTVWLSTLTPDFTLLIKSWKEIIMLLLMPLAVVLISQRKLWREFGDDWIFRLLISYALLHLMTAILWWQGANQTMAGMAADLRYVLFFGLVYTLIRVAPRFSDLMIKVALAGAIIVLGFATLQLILPSDILANIGYSDQTIKPYQKVDENPDYIRVNSTLRGPNPLGAYAAAALIILAAFVATKKQLLKSANVRALAYIVAFCGAVALWISYSRSALVGAIIGLAIVWAVVIGKKIDRNIMIGAIVFTIVMMVGLFVIRDSSFVHNVILHDNPTTGAVETSNDGHVSSLQFGFNRMLAQPLGAGIGSTGSASLLDGGSESVIIESQYLFIAHEAGWVGISIYVCIFAAIMWRLFACRKKWLALGVFASGISLTLIGFLLPVWIDDTVSIVWWGLAGLALASCKMDDDKKRSKHGKRASKQKTA